MTCITCRGYCHALALGLCLCYVCSDTSVSPSILCLGLLLLLRFSHVYSNQMNFVLIKAPNTCTQRTYVDDLTRRVHEHRQGTGSAFTKKYRVHRLVYMEPYDDIEFAIQREKTMKEWPRVWKIRQIERDNPE